MGRPLTPMPGGLLPREHEVRRKALGLSKERYAISIGCSPSKYIARTNPSRLDMLYGGRTTPWLDHRGATPEEVDMNDPSARPTHVQCPGCGYQVPLRHALTQAEARAELSAKTGIPLDVMGSVSKVTALALLDAWERRQPNAPDSAEPVPLATSETAASADAAGSMDEDGGPPVTANGVGVENASEVEVKP